MEEIYRIDSVQCFLKNFPTYNWKNMIFLLIEYGVMLFEHNFNTNQICYNDVCKIVEDLKYEKYNFIKTTDKKLHSLLSKNLIIERNENQNMIEENLNNNNFNNRVDQNYINNNFQNQNNSERVNFRFSAQNSSRQSRIDPNSKSNFNNLNSNVEFGNTNMYNNGMTSKINTLKNIPESYDTNYFSNRALSPTKSFNSNNSVRSQILERALDQSPTVKPGKFVFLEEDPFTKEVLIKVNKETYENHIKNNNNNLVFEKSKKNYEKFIKPISDQTERLKNYKSNKKNVKKEGKDKYSVDEILQKLKFEKKKEYDTYSTSTVTDINNFIVKETENSMTNTISNTDSISNNKRLLKNNLAEINKKMQNDDSTFLNEKLLKYDKNKKNKFIPTKDDDTVSNDKTIYMIKGSNNAKGKSKKIVINTYNNLKDDYSILSDYDENDSINTTEEIIYKSKKDKLSELKNYSIKDEFNTKNIDNIMKNNKKSKNFTNLDYDLYQTNSINETESVLSTFYHK